MPLTPPVQLFEDRSLNFRRYRALSAAFALGMLSFSAELHRSPWWLITALATALLLLSWWRWGTPGLTIIGLAYSLFQLCAMTGLGWVAALLCHWWVSSASGSAPS